MNDDYVAGSPNAEGFPADAPPPDLDAAGFAMANDIRRSLNGVMGVILYLGRDGDNACELKDVDGRTLVRCGSGRSLLEAVERANASLTARRNRDYYSSPFMVAREAARLYAERPHPQSEPVADGVFHESDYIAFVTDHLYAGSMEKLPSDPIKRLLSGMADDRRIIKLDYPGLWCVVPGCLRRA